MAILHQCIDALEVPQLTSATENLEFFKGEGTEGEIEDCASVLNLLPHNPQTAKRFSFHHY